MTEPTEPQEVEITIKVKMTLPAEWERPPQPYIGPFARFLGDEVYRIADKWRPRSQVWIGDSLHHMEGEVTDVEADAGEWGFDAWTPESDGRLRIEMVMVPR